MDSFLGIGLPELFFIAVLALIILGPERLPGTLREIAKAWGYIRNLGRELTSQFSEEFKALEDLNPRKLLNELADEELAKDLQNLTKKPTSTTTAKPSTTKPATTSTTAKTTKPATTTGSTAAAGSTTGKSEAKAKPTEKPATGSAGDGIPESSGSTENSILPPLAPAPEPSAETENAPAPADSLSLSGSKAEQPPAAGETSLPSTTAVSVNGIGVNGATDPGESGS